MAGTLIGQHGPAAPEEVESNFLRARAIAGQLGDYDALLRAVGGLRLFCRFRQEYGKSRALGEEALATAQAHRQEAVGSAHFGLGETLLFSGDFEQALHHYQQALSSGKSVISLLGADAQPLILAECGLTRWILGYPAQAADLSCQGLTRARSDGDVALLSVVLLYAALHHQLAGDWATTMREAEELLGLSDARGSTYFSAAATALRGWALARQGRTDQGLLEMRGALAAHAAGSNSRTFEWGRLAEIYGGAGQPGAGLELIENALEQVSRTGERILETDLHRIRGELLLAENPENCDAAEQSIRRAIEIAQRQKAKSWELRATRILACLLMKQGRRDEARVILAEIYNWFTEGFDTADLIDAKVLLEELQARPVLGEQR